MPAGVRVPAQVRLGSVLVTPATVLAPMAGVTGHGFPAVYSACEPVFQVNRGQANSGQESATVEATVT